MSDTIALSVSTQFFNKDVRPEVLAPLRQTALAWGAAGKIYKKTGKVYQEKDRDNIPYGYGWQPRQLTLKQLYEHVALGDAFCVALLKSDNRKKANFASSQLIGVDLDKNAVIDRLVQNEFISRYAGLLYASSSSVPEMPKSRVLFMLDRSVTVAQEYCDYVLRILAKFADAGAFGDQHCKDEARLFYGSTKAAEPGNYVLTDNVLPIEVVKALPKPTNQRPPEWYAQRALNTASLMIQRSNNGHKHGELLKASRLLGGYVESGILQEPEAIALLEREIGAKSDVEDINAAYATIRDGLAYGRAKSITLEALEAQRQDYLEVNGYTMNISPNGTAPNTQKIETPAKPGHDILRDRWLSSQPPTAYGLGDFRRYHAGIWQPVNELEIEQSIIETIEAAKPEGIKPTMAIASSVTGFVKRKVVKPDHVWDANSDYLVCRNGTLCIPDRILGQHNPTIYATSGVSFDYDPSAKAPAWGAFLFDLAQSTSPAIVDFLQEFGGYALTTDTRYELSIWLYGTPGAGRSTFLTGLQAMLGSRAGLLGLADIVSNRFALANLPGKTLAISTEQPGDYIASTHILNAIISGETIVVDRKFRDAIEITPRCKLAWAMNDLPRVSDPNSGLFRRVKVIEFPVIPEAQQDPELKETIKTEGAGILNWALDGLDRLRKRGRFDIPQEVRDATNSFRDNNDIPARFVEELCFTGNDQKGDPYRVSGSLLYDAYKTWCLTTGHKPQSSTSIANDWRRLGFEKYEANGRKFWRYVGLKT